MNVKTDKNWIARPLNRTGDLNGWQQRMKKLCPEPKLGEIVWLNNLRSKVGYKMKGFNRYGDPH